MREFLYIWYLIQISSSYKYKQIQYTVPQIWNTYYTMWQKYTYIVFSNVNHTVYFCLFWQGKYLNCMLVHCFISLMEGSTEIFFFFCSVSCHAESWGWRQKDEHQRGQLTVMVLFTQYTYIKKFPFKIDHCLFQRESHEVFWGLLLGLFGLPACVER